MVFLVYFGIVPFLRPGQINVQISIFGPTLQQDERAVKNEQPGLANNQIDIIYRACCVFNILIGFRRRLFHANR